MDKNSKTWRARVSRQKSFPLELSSIYGVESLVDVVDGDQSSSQNRTPSRSSYIHRVED